MTIVAERQHLRRAREHIEEEQERLRAERSAFDAFRSRVTGLNPEPAPRAGQTRATGSIVLSKSRATMLEQVCTAYRETVMDVDHYSEDYDEPLAVNMSKELGDGLSNTVTSGQQFTLSLKRALLEASEVAAENRSEFLRKVTQESASLREAESELEQLKERQRMVAPDLQDCSYTELVALWDELCALESEYEEICSERQEQLQRRRKQMSLPDGMPTLCDYMYTNLPVTYPILVESLEQLRRIRSKRKRVVWLLSHLD